MILVAATTTATTTKTIVSTDNSPWPSVVGCSGMRKLHATIDNAITAASSDIESDDDEHSAIDLKNYDKLNSSSAYNSSRDSTNGNNRHHSHHHRSASHHRISESPYVNNSLTKCAKMTEEHGMIRNGSSINGVGSANACSTPSPPLPPPPTTSSSAAIAAAATTANNNKLPIVINSNGQTTGIGGRLQFFKHGKIILELARSREGDKTSWVSVPRKTFWPPTAPTANNVNHHKNESSTSLSFSDDNSSIQSSPWQRDHCLKQTSPRRNISKEMCLYFHRPSVLVLTRKSRAIAKCKRRRPYDNKNAANEIVDHEKRAANDDGIDISNGTTTSAPTSSTHAPIDADGTTCEMSVENNENNVNDAIDEATEAAARTKPDEKDKVNNESNEKLSDEQINVKSEENKGDASETVGVKCEASDTVDSISSRGGDETKGSSVDDSAKLTENGDVKVKAEPMIVDECPGDEPANPLKADTRPDDQLPLKSKTLALLKRPKLASIIQKLIIRVQDQPLNAVTTKTGPGASLSATGNYISPSSAMISRNNDLYYHQQHVSPRKRILREFEKVSLEDSTGNHTKRSRSKNTALNGVGHAGGVSTVNASSTAMLPTNTMSGSRNLANGNHSTPSTNTSGHQSEAISKSPMTSTSNAPSTTATPPASRPFSSYSITSLLGHSVNHNNSSSSSSSNSSNNGKIDAHSITTARDGDVANDYLTRRISPRSPPTPVSPAHQSSLSSSRLSSSNGKKKSPTNGSLAAATTSSSSSIAAVQSSPYQHQHSQHHQPHHRSPMNSPVNYGRAVTRSPNLSPSPEQAFRHQRSQFNSVFTSISSPTSGFHPYMPPTSRASPSTSGALSPPMTNELHRYRNSYKTIGSPGSSIGAAHSYSSTSGSPSSYSARYSPSTYSQLSPPPASTTSQQNKSTGSPYNVSSFLQNASAMNSRHREVSPPRSSSASSAMTGTSTRTIPKKTASIRQQYDSPNSDKCNYAASRSSSANDNSPPSTRSEPSPHSTRRTLMDVVSAEQSPKSGSHHRSASPSDALRRQFEKEYHSRAAELDRPPPLIPSVHSDGMPPPSPHHPYYGLYPAQSAGAAAAAAATVSQSMAAVAAAAYLPAYYHQMAYAAAYRNSMSWMHHPYPVPPPPLSPTSRSLLPLAADTPQLSHSNVYNHSSAYKSIRRPLAVPFIFDSGGSAGNATAAIDPAQASVWASNTSPHALHHMNDAPIPLLKEDASADVPLNLSKH